MMIDEIGVLFCCDYFTHSQPDPDYAVEYDSAIACGLPVYLFDFDRFTHDSILRMQPQAPAKMLMYRGWMMTSEQYARLSQSLSQQGFTLVTSPEEYVHAHYLPSWYDLVKKDTARSVWSHGIPDDAEMKRLLSNFDHQALIVKDYVKSRKHEWAEAFYIPDSSDTIAACKVIDTFVDRQGEDLAGGVVLREFVPLAIIGHHEISGMPIGNEVRVFCFHHQVAAQIEYWSGACEQDISPCQRLIDAAQCVNSPFFTIDMAQKADGDWMIIEIGDGGVSGLQNFDPTTFYTNLAALL